MSKPANCYSEGTMLAPDFLKGKPHSTTTFKPGEMEILKNRDKKKPANPNAKGGLGGFCITSEVLRRMDIPHQHNHLLPFGIQEVFYSE